jgi:hypothetical protein
MIVGACLLSWNGNGKQYAAVCSNMQRYAVVYPPLAQRSACPVASAAVKALPARSGLPMASKPFPAAVTLRLPGCERGRYGPFRPCGGVKALPRWRNAVLARTAMWLWQREGCRPARFSACQFGILPHQTQRPRFLVRGRWFCAAWMVAEYFWRLSATCQIAGRDCSHAWR